MNEDGLAKSFGDAPQSHVQTITANVTSEDDWKKMVQLAKDKFGGVDIVINNAGKDFSLTLCQSKETGTKPSRHILQKQTHYRCHRSRV